MSYNIKGVILLTFILFLGLSLTFNTNAAAASDNQAVTTNNTSNSQITNQSSSNNINFETEGSTGSTTSQTIKVLIYNGDKVAKDSADGIKTALDSSNANNLVPGYYFTYNTSTIIDSTVLASYDVLAMPGGNDYITSYEGTTIDSINADAIKNFVASGKGYLGICAGAFAGANNTANCYNGWGVAPHVNCLQPYYEGTTSIQITSAGQTILGKAGNVTTLYWNGPAMTVNGNASVLATYVNGITDKNGNIIISKGMAAIVSDYYGNGRSVLIGPHPELEPQSADIIANLIVWAANLTPTSSTAPPPAATTTPPPAATSSSPTVTSGTILDTSNNANTSTNDTVPMQKTGAPLIPLALATLIGVGGLVSAKIRK